MASTSKKVLMGAQVLTATGTSDAQTLSPRWKSFVGTIKTTAQNAATTVAGTIEHSSNGTDWHTLESFTNIVGATPTIEAKNITANVLGHVRAVATLSGATEESTVTIELCYDTDK